MLINVSEKHATGEYGESCLAKDLPKAILAKLLNNKTSVLVGLENKMLFLYSDYVTTSAVLSQCFSKYVPHLKGTVITFTQNEV
jgi:hypothetical protein